MASSIEHQGIVENIDGSCIRVRIAQTSACSHCSAASHCASSDVKEKVIDVHATDAADYHEGDRVCIVGDVSLGATAVLYAFIFPFVLLVVALFVFSAVIDNELLAALCALVILVPYYLYLRFSRFRLARKLSFSIRRMD